MIKIKRIYDTPTPDDGIRILVDRLWPRGLSKEKAKVDLWLKEIAPSNELRKWYAHDPKKWTEFRKWSRVWCGFLRCLPHPAHLLGSRSKTTSGLSDLPHGF